MQEGIWGWDSETPLWRKILVDTSGHLIVDNPDIETLLAGGLPSVLVSDSLKVREQGVVSVRCMAWDGGDYEYFQMESTSHLNLKVRLFAGANAIGTALADNDITTELALVTKAVVMGVIANDNVDSIRADTCLVDNLHAGRVSLEVKSKLYGFDGETFDRLRTWGTGVLKVARAGTTATITRMTGTGQVGATGAHYLYWVACSPDSANAEWELSDATSSGQAVVYDHFDTDKHSEHITFDPPMPFTNGIYLEKFDHQKSLVFCYV